MNGSKQARLHKLCSAIFLCVFSVGVFAETSVAILDFELSDVTMAPRIPAEIERTASIKAMLEGELKRAGFDILPRLKSGGFLISLS